MRKNNANMNTLFDCKQMKSLDHNFNKPKDPGVVLNSMNMFNKAYYCLTFRLAILNSVSNNDCLVYEGLILNTVELLQVSKLNKWLVQ